MAAIRFAKAGASATGTSSRLQGAVEGMLAGTRVLTLEGSLPVEYLTIGDRLVTRSGAARVTGVEMTLVQNARVIRIGQDTLGIDTPHDDVTVAAAQTIALRGWRAKALCGTDRALVAARRLADGAYIKAETLAEARLFKLTFAEPTMIYAGGLELGCDKTSACV